MAKITRRHGQKNLTGAQYRAINSAVIRIVRKTVEGPDGHISAGKVRNYIKDHEPELRKAYRALGLRGVEIPRTYDNLKASVKYLRDGRGLIGKVNDALNRGKDRRVSLIG